MVIVPGLLVTFREHTFHETTSQVGASSDNLVHSVSRGTIGVVVAMIKPSGSFRADAVHLMERLRTERAFLVLSDGTMGWTYQTSLVSVA